MNSKLLVAFVLFSVFANVYPRVVLDQLLNLKKERFQWTIVKVTNRGAYVARFSVRYISADGSIKSYETGRFEVGQSRTLEVEPTATSVLIKVENDIFINNWSTIFTVNVPYAINKCFTVGGTTLFPSWSEQTEGCDY